jgi:ParD-like antitoxin of type II bacterial toxin-antitoxin system
MGMAVKLSDDLVKEARQEAEVTDRSLTSQIEHWARLGRKVERVLQHEEILNLKRAGETPLTPPTRRAVMSALRRVASEGSRPELAATLREGRTVYQDAGDGRVERIERDGTRTVGRFVNRRFTADEPKPATRRR